MSEGFARERVGFVAAVLICVVAFVGTVAQGNAAREGGTSATESRLETVGGDDEARPAFAEEDLEALCDPYDYEEVDLASSELDAAEKAAGEFTRAAYGYSASDSDAYERGVERRVLEECFWESSAGDEVEATEEMVRQGGEASAPDDWYFFEGFVGYYVGGEERVYGESGAEYLRVYGYAVWVSRKARAGVGEEEALAGYQQGLTITKRVGEREWRVAYGESVSAYPSSDYEHAIDEKIEEIAAEE